MFSNSRQLGRTTLIAAWLNWLPSAHMLAQPVFNGPQSVVSSSQYSAQGTRRGVLESTANGLPQATTIERVLDESVAVDNFASRRRVLAAGITGMSQTPQGVAGSKPVREVISRNVKFELASAIAVGKTLTVTLFATNAGVDTTIRLRPYNLCCYGWGSTVIDDSGNSYLAGEYHVANQTLGADLINDVRTQIVLRFENLPTAAGVVTAQDIRRLRIAFLLGSQSEAAPNEIDFRNVPIDK